MRRRVVVVVVFGWGQYFSTPNIIIGCCQMCFTVLTQKIKHDILVAAVVIVVMHDVRWLLLLAPCVVLLWVICCCCWYVIFVVCFLVLLPPASTQLNRFFFSMCKFNHNNKPSKCSIQAPNLCGFRHRAMTPSTG